jgi:hypothetical protein
LRPHVLAYFHDVRDSLGNIARDSITCYPAAIMADGLVAALESIHLSSNNADLSDDWIDSILDEQRPRKRIKQDQEALKLELEEKYLTPATSFSPEWLNKLQQ